MWVREKGSNFNWLYKSTWHSVISYTPMFFFLHSEHFRRWKRKLPVWGSTLLKTLNILSSVYASLLLCVNFLDCCFFLFFHVPVKLWRKKIILFRAYRFFFFIHRCCCVEFCCSFYFIHPHTHTHTHLIRFSIKKKKSAKLHEKKIPQGKKINENSCNLCYYRVVVEA